MDAEPVNAKGWTAWFEIGPRRPAYRIQCCDCALVHEFDVRVVDGKVQLRGRRDERSTTSARRKR